MSEEGQEKEGLVREILNGGDLTTEEIKERLGEKGVSFVKSYDRPTTVLWIALAILWLLPAIAGWSGWGFLSFFAQLPRVDFPIAAIIVAAVLFLAAISLEVGVTLRRQRQGGCHDTHETVVIVREGPYRVIRHPGYLAEMVYFGLLPIVISKWVPFTILAVAFIVVWTGVLVYLLKSEDSFNVRKWGDEYRQYIKEAPALNFVAGLMNLRRKQAV